MIHIQPAGVYKPADDLCVITSFYNANNYATKYANYLAFIASLERSGIRYRVIECAFNDQPFTLPYSPHIIRVQARSVLWQKERLLNLAVHHLPATCTKVAWVDCDVLFENGSWAVETSRLLDEYAVVQPFEYAIRLPRGAMYYEGAGERYESFAAVYQRTPHQLPIGEFTRHGHTGFAWAMQRDIITKHGLYDACISGSSDHLMVHAFTGDFHSPCIQQMLGDNPFTHQHFQDWARAVYPDVAGKVVSVPGTLLHLWHGDTVNRQYLRRNQEVARLHFNPYEDISLNAAGCWEWSTQGLLKTQLPEWAIASDLNRKEDEYCQ